MNRQPQRHGVLAIVVTHYPNMQDYARLLRALEPQVQAVVAIDNTPRSGRTSEPYDIGNDPGITNLRTIYLGRNTGIAAAQNCGIDIAIKEGFEHVLFCDQDSEPEPQMVEQLLKTLRTLRESGARVGCVCPAYIEINKGTLNRFQIQPSRRSFYSFIDAGAAVPSIEIVTAISSGSLIPTAVFRHTGLMRDDYFIDYVDTEWCHRARAHGYALYGTALARMRHREGGDHFAAWAGRWKTFPSYAPLRLRYRFRNAVLLLRSRDVPFLWKLRSTVTWIGDAYANVLFGRQRWKNLCAIQRGIADGIVGRTGVLL